MLQATEISHLDVVPPLTRTVIGLDPPRMATEKDPCFAVVAGISQEEMIAIKSCHSLESDPARWGAVVHRMAIEHDAMIATDQWCLDLVEAVIRPMGGSVPITRVRMNTGRYHRMEKVWSLYAEHRVKHAENLSLLEREICEFSHLPGAPHDYLDPLYLAIEALLPRPKPANFRFA